MDLVSCGVCGGIFEKKYIINDERTIYVVNCPYCGNEQAFVVNNHLFSFVKV